MEERARERERERERVCERERERERWGGGIEINAFLISIMIYHNYSGSGDIYMDKPNEKHHYTSNERHSS